MNRRSEPAPPVVRLLAGCASRFIVVAVAALTACIDGASVGDLPEPTAADAAPPPDAHLLGACSMSPACAAPSSRELATVCGRLYDVRSQAPLQALAPVGVACDPMNPTESGPCSVCINAYAPAALVVDPGDARPLDTGVIELDDCGRYRIVDIAPPPDGTVALLAGNCIPVANQWAPTAVSIRTTPEMLLEGKRLFATERTADREWTDSAARPFGDHDTFVSRGAVLATFVHGQRPHPGVTFTFNGRPAPTGTFYFADPPASVGSLASIDTGLSETGTTGSAMAAGTDFVLHGGTGGEPLGCVWPSQRAASIPGVLFVQHNRAVSAPTGDLCHDPEISGNLR